jgi:hypothetical protein
MPASHEIPDSAQGLRRGSASRGDRAQSPDLVDQSRRHHQPADVIIAGKLYPPAVQRSASDQLHIDAGWQQSYSELEHFGTFSHRQAISHLTHSTLFRVTYNSQLVHQCLQRLSVQPAACDFWCHWYTSNASEETPDHIDVQH